MPYAPFYKHCEDVAARETRTATVRDGAFEGLPAGAYTFLELYCDEPDCDCRRVFLCVVSADSTEPLAVIAYGWESREFYVAWMGDDEPMVTDELKGPALNLASPQSALSPVLLKFASKVLLGDEDYVERIKRHYHLFRKKIDVGQKA